MWEIHFTLHPNTNLVEYIVVISVGILFYIHSCFGFVIFHINTTVLHIHRLSYNNNLPQRMTQNTTNPKYFIDNVSIKSYMAGYHCDVFGVYDCGGKFLKQYEKRFDCPGFSSFWEFPSTHRILLYKFVCV